MHGKAKQTSMMSGGFNTRPYADIHGGHTQNLEYRPDFFLTSSNFSAKIVKSDILPSFGSDHSAPQVHLNMKKESWGKGF